MFSVMGCVVARARCGGWEFPPRVVRARPLNPRTPARPDLKSGAVVLAWLPPHAAHRAIGIMLLLRCSETFFSSAFVVDRNAISDHLARALDLTIGTPVRGIRRSPSRD